MKSYKYIKKLVVKKYLSVLVAGSIGINICSDDNSYVDKTEIVKDDIIIEIPTTVIENDNIIDEEVKEEVIDEKVLIDTLIEKIDDSLYEYSVNGYFGLTYNQELDNYVAFGGNKMYILNNCLEEINEFDIPTNLTKQSITVKNNLIYYLCFEKGRISLNQTSIDFKRADTNYVFVYDYDGNIIDSYYIPNIYGGGEGIFFNKDELFISVNTKKIHLGHFII